VFAGAGAGVRAGPAAAGMGRPSGVGPSQIARWELPPYVMPLLIALACVASGALLYRLVELPFMALRARRFPTHFVDRNAPAQILSSSRLRQSQKVAATFRLTVAYVESARFLRGGLFTTLLATKMPCVGRG